MFHTTYIGLDVHARTVTAAALNAATGEITETRMPANNDTVATVTAKKIRVIGKVDLLEPLNRAVLQIARRGPDAKLGNLMAGAITNTNMWEPDKCSGRLFGSGVLMIGSSAHFYPKRVSNRQSYTPRRSAWHVCENGRLGCR